MANQRFDIDAYERRSHKGPCFVCLIADGDANQRADNEVIFEDDEVLVFLDRYPTVEGYVLVCPRRHVEHVTGDLIEDEYVALQRWVHRVGEALRRSVPTERLYVLSLGSQQGNRHVHWSWRSRPVLRIANNNSDTWQSRFGACCPSIPRGTRGWINEFAPT